MIWNDDKIKRLMSMGMMHGGRGDDATSAAGGTGEASSDDTGGGGGFGGPSGDGGDSMAGLSNELSVDLGGGVTVGLDSRTGEVTSTRGGDPGGVEGALAQVEEPSSFGQFLNGLTGKQKGAAIGGLLGTLAGIGPLAGAQLGASLGGKLGAPDTGLTQQAPGQTQAQARSQQAPGQTPGAVATGVSQGGLSGLGGIGDVGGGEGQQQALQLAASGRQSGLAAPPQAQPQLPQLGGRQFLDRSGVLPKVNLQAFPGALGRTV